MASLRFGSFGAATMPLSKIVIDKDLDMGLYAIKGVYRPEEWPTETLDWGDIPPGEPIPFEGSITGKDTWITLFTFDVPAGGTYKWRFTFIIQGDSSNKGTLKITANGEEIFYVTDVSVNMSGITWTFDVIIPAGSTVTIQWSKNTNLFFKVLSGSNVQNLGIVGTKTFDLSGKWLALGLDMTGHVATVKIHGVEVPYSDYAKYFPIVPTELKIIPVDWGQTQERPVIKVYKHA